ncbi:MAG: uracil-DNA glycosylase [Gemmataceae bacterium]|nr:uracil-DNA glycosylase [Gemmata sp.]MDW8199556.1 uracil-DNA glycosylase [Gemmataceae bacterium]
MTVDDPKDWRWQLRHHLESLQAAGVLFVPRVEMLATAGATSETREEPAAEIRAAADPLAQRRQALATLAAEVASCNRCRELFACRTQAVFGTGPCDAPIAFVGVAPDAEEDAQGEPFVGRTGERLNRMLAACGLSREQVYLLTILKCRTPKNRLPTNSECLNCRDYFQRQFDLIAPGYVVALGAFVAKLLTHKNAPLAELRGVVHQYRGKPLICTHHPKDLDNDKTDTLRRQTWEDLKLLLRTMGRPVPGGSG